MVTGQACTKEKPCPGMAYALDRPERRDRTGIEFAHVFDLKGGAMRPIGYLYRRTSKDGGIILNLCPFCGAEFETLWPRKKEG